MLRSLPCADAGSDPGAGPAAAAHFLQQRSNAVVRKELAVHLHQQTALLTGYADFLQRNACTLLTLCLDRPPAPGASPTAEATITGAPVLAAQSRQIWPPFHEQGRLRLTPTATDCLPCP